MIAIGSHPPFEQLAAFGLGRLDDRESAEIEVHLSSCETCRGTVESLPNDEFINRLRGTCDPVGTFAAFADETSHSPESLRNGSTPSSDGLFSGRRNSAESSSPMIGSFGNASPSTRQMTA